MKPTTPDRSSQFDALEVAYELIRSLRPIVAKMQRHDPKEAIQLRDAANSIARNISEGNRRTGKDRAQLFKVAAGSADEVRGSLRNGLSWGYLEMPELTDSFALVDRELAMLWKL